MIFEKFIYKFSYSIFLILRNLFFYPENIFKNQSNLNFKIGTKISQASTKIIEIIEKTYIKVKSSKKVSL